MSPQFGFLRLLQCRQLAALLLGILLVLPATNTWADGAGWAAILGGIAEGIKKTGEDAEQQRRQDAQFEQQKQLIEYQYQLERERQQRAHELEMQRQERERAERARAQDAIRQQQQIAEEKKQQEAAEQKRKAISTGTGFFIAPGGYLVTNHHVVEDATDYAVRDYKGRFYKATVIARDSNRDLALLKVDGAFPALRIISSDSVSKGQRVLAVGYPQISIQGNESKVTDGIISSFSGVRNDENWFQISVPIQGGNSGGPLVTEGGGVVGVVVATANVARFYKMTGNLPQNVNYAIKSKVLLEFLSAQNLQNVSATKGKVSVEAIDASTVMVVSKNGPIEVAYTASPEQLAREKRDREIAAAKETRRQKEEALAEQKRQVEERRAEKQRTAESELLAKRDQAVLKAHPDWQKIRDSNIFVAWLAEQKKETTDKLNSPKATDVIAVIKQYHVELPKFANRYAATQRPAAPQTANEAVVPPLTPQPSPVMTAAQVIKDCDVCPEMVVIPTGSFEMGSNSEGTSEKPVHRVNIDRFMLGRTEVTQGQWKALMGVNPSNFSQCGDDCPVEQVSWSEAQRYVQKLSQQTGKNYRLPSESEWEYAARAGSQDMWSFGGNASQLDYYAWYGSNSGGKTHGVAQRPANAFGLHDMHGNVWEWVQDVYHSNYSGAPVDGLAWSTGGEQAFRVARGGSWFSIAEFQRSASREFDTADQRNVGIGFRVARTP